MELLAPVGNIENFHAALKSGADAVYVGAPGFNARSLSRDLRLEDIAAMIDYCRARDKKFYIAANSLLLENDLTSVIENLAVLDALAPDALIVQDFGLIRLVHQYFPETIIHGSTLTTAHNSQAVEVMGNFGCDRVVLARELTLKEIEVIAARNEDIELEIFIHGAMCFSYSGLCLFSSFLGGKSGLRGKCVQPCRRSYRTPRATRSAGSKQKGGRNKKVQTRGRQPAQGGKGEYLFSMNDLSGLEAVPKLKEIGISSLKVEGRLRSARYIENTISAYRMMMDAAPHEQDEVLVEAQNLIDKAMSRKTSSGYFFTPQPAEAITPQHSGNMGLHLGRITKIDTKGGKPRAKLKVKDPVAVGDRVRLHIEPGGERLAFTVKELNNSESPSVQCNTGENAVILLPEEINKYRLQSCDLYKVDGKSGAPFKSDLDFKGGKTTVSILKKKLYPQINLACDEVVVFPNEILGEVQEDEPTQLTKKKGGKKQRSAGRRKKGDYRGSEKNLHKELKMPMEWWLRLDSAKTVLKPLPFTPDRFVLSFEPSLIRQAVQIKRYLGRNARKVMWALPPLIAEKDLGTVRKNIKLLIASGFRTFQVAHMSQIELFGREKVHLYGDYSLNMLNAQSLMLASEVGFEGVQFSMETDRENLFNALAAYRQITSVNKDDEKITRIPVGLTVYGTPPLYTARLASSHFQFDKTVVSPKDESFIVRKKHGYTQTFPKKPFSLLPYMTDLKTLGVNYAVVDLTGSPSGAKPIEELAERLGGAARLGKLPTFNYLGTLA